MICCAVIAASIAAVLWLGRTIVPGLLISGNGALAWRPGTDVSRAEIFGKSTPFSWSARARSFIYAFKGIGFVIKNEHNAWIHIGASGVIVTAGMLLEISLQDWIWLLLLILWVWFAEIMNTAFEHLCNVVSPEKNESVRIAKDVAAGAVLISAAAAALIGAAILIPYIFGTGDALAMGSAICGRLPPG